MKKFLVFIFLFMLFVIPFNVSADSLDKVSQYRWSAFNGITIFSNNPLYSAYNWAITQKGEALNLITNVELYGYQDDIRSLLGQELLITIDFCTMEAWNGATDGANISGHFTFIKNLGTTVNGSCSFRGTSYSGTSKVSRVVVSPNNFTLNKESAVYIIRGSISLWGGGYALGGGYEQVNSITVQVFDDELKNQLAILESQNGIKDGLNGLGDKVTGAIGSLQDSLGKKQDETNKNLDDIKDSLTDSDSSGATSSGQDFFDSFEDNNYGLSDIVTMPLSFIEDISSARCTPLVIPLPFVDTDLTLPCMYDIYERYFGSILSIYQTITFGMIAYFICVDVFRMVKNFRDPDKDNIEVLDL